MRRRQFLALTAGGVALGTGRVACGATPGTPAGPAAASVVVTDIRATTDAASLFAVLQAFHENGLWVTCALTPPGGDALDGYGAIVQGLIELAPAVEIALDLPGLGTLSPHFQGRAVFEARRRLAALADGDPPLEVRSVLCRGVEDPTNPVGVRSAGVRDVLVRPDTLAPIRSEAWANGVARFSGGAWLTPGSAILPAAEGAYRLFYLSADQLSAVPEPELRRWAADLASAFLDAELRGEMTAMPVSELQLRDNFGFTRQVALRLVGDSPELRALAGHLATRTIPVLF